MKALFTFFNTGDQEDFPERLTVNTKKEAHKTFKRLMEEGYETIIYHKL